MRRVNVSTLRDSSSLPMTQVLPGGEALLEQGDDADFT